MKNVKRIMSFLLAIILLYGATCNCIYAISEMSENIVGASGEVKTIENLEQLKAFRDEVNSGNSYQGITVKLTANINMENEEWKSIGTSNKPFQGTFNGDGFNIYNFSDKQNEGTSYMGFFGNCINLFCNFISDFITNHLNHFYN